MTRIIVAAALGIVLACSAAIPPPPVLDRKELQLNGGKGLVLSIREPVTPPQVDALIAANRSGMAVIRVFTYAPDKQPGKDTATGLYEWTVLDGLKRKY